MGKTLGLVVTVVLALTAACGGSDSSYDNLEACIHAKQGGVGIPQAIATCILDDTIGGKHLSFPTQGDCELYVDQNTASESAEDIDQGCVDYIMMK